ncbi:unnamed protein product [Candidula unifasciata]|uniref:PBZ-type domain-containing protein n=1 Tax=Candidula unifasciata TaxID=100452 RepID=A0A8S3ZDX2_9EUPU|nr:unnamed protein product [Candidula unifasciata]
MSDEDYARKLQEQFDREAKEYDTMQKSDLALARHVAKAHSISDSEDSDSATSPNNTSSLDGSVDLFGESGDGAKSLSPQHSLISQGKKNSHTKQTDSSSDIYEADTDVDDKSDPETEAKSKPVCKYGSKCYRKNPSHLKEFCHPGKRKGSEGAACEIQNKKVKGSKDEKTPLDVFNEFQPISFFLTKVHDIPSRFNTTGAMSLKDILSKSMGELKESCHFNFMFDIPWLVKQYPEEYRKLPLLLVHGDQGRDELGMKADAQHYSNITFCRAPLEIPYGTHHTKMMLLLYSNGLRVVVHTANLIENDWHQKTQGVFIIGSVPGRHTLASKQLWGHLKLRKVLSSQGPDGGLVKNWPVVGQFSSIGSLGPNKEAWLLSELGQSLCACRNSCVGSASPSKLHLIFPSKDNIRLSLEGYNGGGCVPYSIKTASKQPWLTELFCQWVSEGRGRTRAVPHIKTYTRFSPDGSQAAWFLVSSANLSKAAWGVLEKQGSQLMIRSYELGVLFLPQFFGSKNAFPVTSRAEDVAGTDKPLLPLPYDLPPTSYVRGDRPWFCDVPCMDLPDSHGTMWCPPL